MKDYRVWQVAPMLNSYRNIPEFQKSFLEMSSLLVSFLKSNQLFLSERFQDLSGTELDFEVKCSELTVEGRRLFEENHVNRWLAANDNIMKSPTIRRLESGLKKILSGTT